MTADTIRRAACRLIRWTARIAPAPRREWCEAMLAEVEAIPRPAEAFCWSLGCSRVVIREFLVSVLLGARRAGSEWWNREKGVPMRNAVIAAVVVLAVAVGFVVTPGFREGMTLAGNRVIGRDEVWGWAWPHLFKKGGVTEASTATQRHLVELLKEGEQHRDGKLLAYVALMDPRSEVAQQAAEQAVDIDPQWTWVYYFVVERFPKLQTAPRMIAELQQWDPENAVVYLAEADRLVHLRWGVFRRGETPPAVEEPWAATARAFDASKYEDYLRQQFSLKVEVARHRGVVNTPLFAFSLLGGSLGTPAPGMAAPLYADFVLHNAASPAEAAAQARRVAVFGERMMTGHSDRERKFGQKIALKGYETLQTTATGAERTYVSGRIAQLHAVDYQEGRPDALSAAVLSLAFRANALLLMACFSLIVVAAVAMSGAGAVLLLSRGKGGSPRMVRLLWVAAGVMLIGCFGGYLTSRLYADVLTRVLSPDASLRDVPALWAFLSFPLLNPFLTTSLVVLLLLTAAITAREVRRVRRPAAGI